MFIHYIIFYISPAYVAITYLQYPMKFYALLYHVLFVYIFGMSLIGQCLFKKQDRLNIEITYLILLIIIGNLLKVFSFSLALYLWEQITLS